MTLTQRTALNALVLLSLTTLGSVTARAACYGGEGLGYVSSYPWHVPSSVRRGGFFTNFQKKIETGNSSLMYRSHEEGRNAQEHKRWRVVLERNGKSLDWFHSSFEERSQLLEGASPEALVREVTFRQVVTEIAADGTEKQVGQTQPLRAVYFFPLLVAHKFAEKHGACRKTEEQVGTMPNLGTQQTRFVRTDESCLFTVDHTDSRSTSTRQSVRLPLISGGAFTHYIDALLERTVTQAQASEYMDSLHRAFLASIEKLAAVESDNAELEADELILARKFYNCRYERNVEGVDEVEFVKRVFDGK